MKDYLIVGLGLAGACFSFECLKNNKTFDVIDSNKIGSSQVAAGVYNPIVLKRFAPIWKTVEQMEIMNKTFSDFEQLLNKKYNYTIPVYRIFHDETEKGLWKTKRLKNPILETYLDEIVIENPINGVNSNHGIGKLNNTGRIDVQQLILDFKNYLGKNFIVETFDYNELKFDSNFNFYKEKKYKKIIFCQGMEMIKNPFFPDFSLIPNKGEILHIKIAETLPQAIFHGKVFLIPIGENEYYVGSTYDREFETEKPTQEGKNYLETELKKFLTLPFEIIDHKAGIRPTTKDRRPIIGTHKKLPLALINGLGTRGTLLAPYVAPILFQHLEYKSSIPREIDFNRFIR